MIVQIQANDYAITPEELKKLTPSYLRGSGKHIRAYTIAHEGTSRPRVVGKGSFVLRWPRSAIQALGKVLKVGTPFYKGGHKATNNRQGDKPIGTVVATAFKTIKDKLHHIIVGAFDSADTSLDVVSMEADAEWTNDGVVHNVTAVNGIAASSSRSDSPAFEGARLHAAMQFFDEEPEPVDLDDDADFNEGPSSQEALKVGKEKEDAQMTYQDVLKGIKEFNIHPSQAYTLDELKKDREFGPIFDEAAKHKADNEKLVKDLADIKKSSGEIEVKAKTVDATATLDKMLSSGYTKQQVSFIKARFKPSKEEDFTEAGIKAYIESAVKEHTDMAVHFGATSEKGQPLEKGAQKSATGAQQEEGGDEASDPVQEALSALA